MVGKGSARKAGDRMSTAQEKNRQAFAALFGNDALGNKLLSTRLAVMLPPQKTRASALLAEVLADVLGRLWPNIDFCGDGAEAVLTTAQSAAESGGAPTDGLRIGWTPPYDFVIGVGTTTNDEQARCLQVGADGWNVQIGQGATCGDSDNPVGPAFAAALAAAQAFLACFANELDGYDLNLLEAWQADLRELFGAPSLQMQALDLGNTHVFGVGAVSHGLLALLERWPREVTGQLVLVDRDPYGISNGQRYAFTKREDSGQLKVARMAQRLRAKLSAEIIPHALDLNTYCANRGYDTPLQRVIAGLDSEEARRQVALKLPERTLNMWTSGIRIGAGQYVPGDGRGCLFCAYPEPTEKLLDEVAETVARTGLRPDIVRNLFDSARGMTEAEAAQVAIQFALPLSSIVGEPLRSVLPALCATGRIQAADKSTVDVPFAFSSLLSGIAGFMMLLRDIQLADSVSEGWSQHIFKAPSTKMMQYQGRHESCVPCKVFDDCGVIV